METHHAGVRMLKHLTNRYIFSYTAYVSPHIFYTRLRESERERERANSNLDKFLICKSGIYIMKFVSYTLF